MRWSCKRKTNMATPVKRSLCRMTQNQSNQKGQNSLLPHKHKLYAFCTMAKFIKIRGVWRLHSNVGKQKTNKQSWEPLEKAGIAGTRSATCLTYPREHLFLLHDLTVPFCSPGNSLACTCNQVAKVGTGPCWFMLILYYSWETNRNRIAGISMRFCMECCKLQTSANHSFSFFAPQKIHAPSCSALVLDQGLLQPGLSMVASKLRPSSSDLACEGGCCWMA